MVLEGYKQNKKTFTNPLESAVGGLVTRTNYLDDIFPNLLWISHLYLKLGLDKTINFVNKICKASKVYGFMHEMYSKINAEILLTELTEAELTELKETLFDFVVVFPHSPISKIYSQKDFDTIHRDFKKSLEEIGYTAIHLDYKYSEVSIITFGILINCMISNGKLSGIDNKYIDLKFLEQNILNNDVIGEFGGVYRSSIQCCLIMNDSSKRWANYFWKRGLCTRCHFLEGIFGEDIRDMYEDSEDGLSQDQLQYILKTTKQFQIIIPKIIESIDYEKHAFSIDRLHREQIIFGLINRELNLLRKILSNHNLWEKEVVSILFRSVVENHIHILWFHKKASEEDAYSFIDYGLGNMVLYNSKLKEKSEKIENNTYFKKLIKKFDRDLEKEANSMMQNVRVGNWTTNTARTMSIDINRKELHDLYSVYSDMSHGSWNVLIDKYMKFCTNPFHKRHKIPKKYYDIINFPTPFMCMNFLLELLNFLRVEYQLFSDKKIFYEVKEIRDGFEIKFLKRWRT